MVIILLLALILLCFCLRSREDSLLEGWLKGIAVWGSFLFIQTEGMSVFRCITPMAS